MNELEFHFKLPLNEIENLLSFVYCRRLRKAVMYWKQFRLIVFKKTEIQRTEDKILMTSNSNIEIKK